MSQQINLINPAFHKVFDWLTATPVALAACVMLVIIGGTGTWASQRAQKQEAVANETSKTLKDTQDKLLAMTKVAVEKQPNADIAVELANAVAMLKNREEILRVLESGAIGSTTGFADFLRGFARQTPSGLWLTGFTISGSGSNMEIRGRMTEPSALPEYIRRLKSEPIFQGRSFAALTIQKPAELKDRNAQVVLDASGKPVANKETQPKFVDFVLMPSETDTPSPQASGGLAPRPATLTAASPQTLASTSASASASAASKNEAAGQKPGFVDPVLTPATDNLGRAAMEELKKGNAETKALEEASKKLQELMPSGKKP